MSRAIRTAVFPAAGRGSRLLPMTRHVPKEMLTISDRPMIQYAVDEARAAGIERCVFVVSPTKSTITDYFRADARPTGTDWSHGPTGAVGFVIQDSPRGLGHAVWCARKLVGDEPFAVLLPDIIVRAEPGGLSQIIRTYDSLGGNVVSLVECSPEEAQQCGIAEPGERIAPRTFRLRSVVEKPPPGSAPSNLKMNGRYVFQPGVFDCLARLAPGAGGEIQLTDAIAKLCRKRSVIGVHIEGRSFNCGSREGLLAASEAIGVGKAVEQTVDTGSEVETK